MFVYQRVTYNIPGFVSKQGISKSPNRRGVNGVNFNNVWERWRYGPFSGRDLRPILSLFQKHPNHIKLQYYTDMYGYIL